jgi:CDP-diacylglycerol---glycerol-3-phosphate 3-phosphatidyltransferase
MTIDMNLPNQLTLARLVMVPLFVVLLLIDTAVALALAYVVFTAAVITDYYDGKIARDRQLITSFGKLFDPLADKVLMTSAFVMSMELEPLAVPGWAVIAVISREFLVTGARSLGMGGGEAIAANVWGKAKTIVQMVYIFTFLFFAIVARVLAGYMDVGWFVRVIEVTSYWGMVAVALVTVYSGIYFAQVNWRALTMGNST